MRILKWIAGFIAYSLFEALAAIFLLLGIGALAGGMYLWAAVLGTCFVGVMLLRDKSDPD